MYKFPSAGICIDDLSSPQSFSCQDVSEDRHGGKGVQAVEFSDDGSYFVSDGDDDRVLLWPTSEITRGYETDRISEMKTKHQTGIVHSAIGPDNRRIVSGCEENGELLVHDTDT